MTQCIGVKPSGELCRGIAARGSDYCPAHDPKRVEARKRAASKAAKSKPVKEVGAVRGEVRELIEEVRAGRLDRGDAIALNQLYGTILRAVQVGLKAEEQLELEERLGALEDALRERKDGSRRWG